MSSTRFGLMDVNERSVLSGVNELDVTESSMFNDSLDRNSSCSSVRMDYQRLMNDHERRAAILEQYRLLVDSRKQQQQQEEEKQHAEEQETHEQFHESSMPKKREGQQQHPLTQQDDNHLQPRSKSSRFGGSALSERGSVNERQGILDSKHSKCPSSPTTAAVPTASTTTSTTTTTTTTCNNTITTNTVGIITAPDIVYNSGTVSNVCIRHGKNSCSWTRPRNAMTSTTASSTAKRRAKVNSTPNTSRKGGEQNRKHGRTITTRMSTPTTTPISSMNSSFLPSPMSQGTQRSQLCEPIESMLEIWQSPSLLRPPCTEPFNDLTDYTNMVPIHNEGREYDALVSTLDTREVAESGVVAITTTTATATTTVAVINTTTNTTTTTATATAVAVTAAGGRSSVVAAREGRRTTTSRPSILLNCSISSSEHGGVAVPNSQNTTILEIATEEDKEHQQHQRRQLEYHKVPSTTSSENRFRSVSKSTTSENLHYTLHGPQEREKESRQHPLQVQPVPHPTGRPIAVEDCGEEASFMTAVTGNTTDIASPHLWRFDSQQKEREVSNNNNNNDKNKRKKKSKNTDGKTYGIFIAHREVDKRKKKIQTHIPDTESCASGKNTCSEGRTTLPKLLLNTITTSVHNHDEYRSRTLPSSISPPGTFETVDDDKAACIATVAAVLQGILVQRRRVFPCYYCGESQQVSAYHLHLDICRTHTEALYARYGLNPLRLVMSEPQQPVPTVEASASAKEAFARACYHSLKASMVPCPGCGELFRIHDLQEHHLACGSRRQFRSKRS